MIRLKIIELQVCGASNCVTAIGINTDDFHTVLLWGVVVCTPFIWLMPSQSYRCGVY